MRRWAAAGAFAFLLSTLMVRVGLALPAYDDCLYTDQTPTTISGDEIKRAGVIRLTGLLRLFPDWHATSTDSYLWDAAPGIFSLPSWDGMTLMIDGQPLTASVLSESYLNTYPLDVGLVDSLVVYEGPVWCFGVFAPSGLIRITTRLEDGYVSAGASGAVANESDDPGPYVWTPLESPNVDRSGPVGSAFGAISGDHWHVRGSAFMDEHHVTDPRIRPRVQRLYKVPHPPRDFLDGRRADARLEFPRASVSVAADEARFEHLRFIPAVGSEVPFTFDRARLGAHGHGRFRQDAALYVSAEYSLVDLYSYPFTPEISVRWQQEQGQLHAGVFHDSPYGRFGAGFSVYQTRVTGESRLIDPALNGSAWQFMAQTRPLGQLAVSAALHLAREESRPLRSGLLHVDWIPFRQHRLRIAFSAAEIPAHRTANLFYWAERGFSAPAIPDLAPPGGVSKDPALRLTASAGYHWAFRDFARLSLTGTVAGFRRFPLPEYDMTLVQEVDRFVREVVYFDTETRLHPEIQGRTARVAVEATVRPVQALSARLYYAYTQAHSGDAVFRDAWAAVPRHRSFASITLAPRDRVSVHARISYESESFWPGFAAVAAASDGLYPDHLPKLALLDLAVTKRFWYDHVKVSALLTNVLDHPVQRHPAGGTEAISLLARIQVEL